jgi:hypothetical protein
VCRVPRKSPIRVLNPDMFRSLPRAFELPSYVGGLAHQFAVAPSPPFTRARPVDRYVLEYLDVEARQRMESDRDD